MLPLIFGALLRHQKWKIGHISEIFNASLLSVIISCSALANTDDFLIYYNFKSSLPKLYSLKYYKFL